MIGAGSILNARVLTNAGILLSSLGILIIVFSSKLEILGTCIAIPGLVIFGLGQYRFRKSKEKH